MTLSSLNSSDKSFHPANPPLSLQLGESSASTGHSFLQNDLEFPSPSDTPRFSGPVPILKPFPPPRLPGGRPHLGKLNINPGMGDIPLFQHVAGPHRIDDVMDESSTISPEERTIRPQDEDINPGLRAPGYGLPQVINVDGRSGANGSVGNGVTSGNQTLTSKIFIGPSTSHRGTSSTNEPERKEFSDEIMEELDRLGEGAGGAVHKVRDKRDGEVFARKTIMTREVAMKQVVREINILQTMMHPNIVAYFGGYISPSSSEVKIIMEYCDGGSLEAVGKKLKEIGGVVGEKISGRLAEGVSVPVLYGPAYVGADNFGF